MKKEYIRPTVFFLPIAKFLSDEDWKQMGDEELSDLHREGIQQRLDSTYVANTEVVLRRILDEWVLVPVNELATSRNGFFTLNNSSRYLWEQFQEPVTLRGVVNKMLGSFEVKSEAAERDVLRFIDEYLMYNLIKKVL
ncbi:PqqD family protein [Bacteroides caecicola]|uniref:PqqD family protein n=1 Tax=Bacteroides caecicola TaxID=1462569 RepID=UPI002012C516|nr:PqqD family protein [Bacteroides caecicola]MCL1624968.1 PqqD family protein [Bacteroides caecicola]